PRRRGSPGRRPACPRGSSPRGGSSRYDVTLAGRLSVGPASSPDGQRGCTIRCTRLHRTRAGDLSGGPRTSRQATDPARGTRSRATSTRAVRTRTELHVRELAGSHEARREARQRRPEGTVQGSTIRNVEVLVASPGRTFVTVRLTTHDGVVGLGDATLNGRELAVAAYLRDHVAPMLVGSDAHRIEDTWQLLFRGAYWRRGPVTMTAIAAIDVALWDIKAKVAGLPLFQLLGGASREGCLAYAHATGHDVPELLDSVRASLAEGFRAVRVQTAVPGLSK